MTIRKRALVLCAAGAVLTTAALPQLLGVSLVSDPGVYTRMATDLSQAIKEFNAIMLVYNNSLMVYANLQRASLAIQSKNAWLPAAVNWRYPSALSTYVNTGPWMAAINYGNGGAAGYNALAIPLQPYNPLIFSALDPNVQAVAAQRYGLIQVQDAVGQNALNTTGQVRASALANNAAINALAADSAANDPMLNTQVGVLNQISAGQVIAARQQTQNAQMFAAGLDLQAAELAERRNDAADAILSDQNFATSYAQISAQDNAGTSAAIQSWNP